MTRTDTVTASPVAPAAATARRRHPLVGVGGIGDGRGGGDDAEVALDAGEDLVDPPQHGIGRQRREAATERHVQGGGRLVEQVAGQPFERRHQAVVEVDQRDEEIAGTEPEQIARRVDARRQRG